MPIITLLSDFGLRDAYVAEMKAIILTVCPNATIVDISHEIEKFNVRMGAFVLATAAPYFPNGTIHVAVVDPGVGGKRRPIVIQTKRGTFVGPDNGLLIPAAERQGIKNVYAIRNRSFMRADISATFHGRDIFAPAASRLARGATPRQVGPEVSDYAVPTFAKPRILADGFECEVIDVDGFGNVITNVHEAQVREMGWKYGTVLRARAARRSFKLPYVRAYSDVRVGRPAVLIGSHGFLEISVNQGSAAKAFSLREGSGLRIAH